MWHPYVLQMVMGVSERRTGPAGSRSARRPYAAANGGELRREIRKLRAERCRREM